MSSSRRGDRDAAIILSVRPEYATKIASGEKKVELRRTNLLVAPRVAVIYSTLPVGRLVAIVGVHEVVRDTPRKLWERFNNISQVEKGRFDSYFQDLNLGTAIIFSEELHSINLPYSSLGIGSRPPQSFMYADMPSVLSNLVLCYSSLHSC